MQLNNEKSVCFTTIHTLFLLFTIVSINLCLYDYKLKLLFAAIF